MADSYTKNDWNLMNWLWQEAEARIKSPRAHFVIHVTDRHPRRGGVVVVSTECLVNVPLPKKGRYTINVLVYKNSPDPRDPSERVIRKGVLKWGSQFVKSHAGGSARVYLNPRQDKLCCVSCHRPSRNVPPEVADLEWLLPNLRYDSYQPI